MMKTCKKKLILLILMIIIFSSLIVGKTNLLNSRGLYDATPNKFILNSKSKIKNPINGDVFSGWQKSYYKKGESVFQKYSEGGVRKVRMMINLSKEFAESASHMAVLIDHLYSEGKNKSRGVLIGNISKREQGDGCKNPPSVQVEHFYNAWVYKNESECKKLDYDTWYQLDIEVSEKKVFYKVRKVSSFLYEKFHIVFFMKTIMSDNVTIPKEILESYANHNEQNIGFAIVSTSSEKELVRIRDIKSGSI